MLNTCSLNLLETFFSFHPVLFIEYLHTKPRGGSDLLYSILLSVQKKGDWSPVSKCGGFGVYSMNKTGGRITRRKMFMTRANAASWLSSCSEPSQPLIKPLLWGEFALWLWVQGVFMSTRWTKQGHVQNLGIKNAASWFSSCSAPSQAHVSAGKPFITTAIVDLIHWSLVANLWSPAFLY